MNPYFLNYANILMENINVFLNSIDTSILENTSNNNLLSIGSLFSNISFCLNEATNYLSKVKEVRMSKQQIKDIEYCLQLVQVRTIQGSDVLIDKYINLIDKNSRIRSSNLNRRFADDNYETYTTIEIEADKLISDFANSFRALESSKEYKRLKEDNYGNDNLILLDITSVVSESKEDRKYLKLFSYKLSKLESIDSDINNKIVSLCNNLIKYYSLRLNLTMYFYKASITTYNDFIDQIDHLQLKLNTKRSNSKYTKVTISREDYNLLMQLTYDIVSSENNHDTNRYISTYKKIINVLGLPDNIVLYLYGANSGLYYPENDNGNISFYVYYFKNDYEKIPINGKKLYHHSISNNILKELNPVGLGNRGSTLYPVPRVYFNINIALNKYTLDPREKLINGINENVKNLYVPTVDIYYVYKDPEMGGSACFVETTKPIPVKRISYDEYLKDVNSYYNESTVNEAADDSYKYFLVSDKYLADEGKVNLKDGKISFYPSIKNALMDFKDINTGRELFVHVPVEGQDIKASKSEDKSAEITGEIWFKEPTKVKCIGKIRVAKPLKTYSYEGGQCKSWAYSWLSSQDSNTISDEESEEEDSKWPKYDNDKFAQDRAKAFNRYEKDDYEDNDIESVGEGFFDRFIHNVRSFTREDLAKYADKCREYIKSYVEENKYLKLIHNNTIHRFDNVDDTDDRAITIAEFDTNKYLNDGEKFDGSILKSPVISQIKKDLKFLLSMKREFKPFSLEVNNKGKSNRYDDVVFELVIDKAFITNESTEFIYESAKAVQELDGALNTFDKLILFNEDAKNDPILRRYLYKQRLMYRKDILALYEQVKNDNPFIRFTYPELSKYQGKNLFIDTYFYTELFFQNNTWTLRRGLLLFFDFMSRLLKQAELTASGYKKHTIFIPVAAWDTNHDASIWDYKRSLNPLSIIYYYMYMSQLSSIKKLFGKNDVVFFGSDCFFKINFSQIDNNDSKKIANKFKMFLIKICKNEEFDPEDIDTSGDFKDEPEVVKAKIIDKIEDARGVDLTPQVAKAATIDKAATSVKTPRQTATSIKKEEEKENAPKNNVSKLTQNQATTKNDDNEAKKQELANQVNTIANTVGDIDAALNNMDDDYIKSLVLSLKPEEDAVDMSAGRAARMSELDKKFLDTNVKGRTIRDILADTSNKEEVKTELKVASPNDEWKNLTYVNFDKNYNVDKDIISCFHHFEKATMPMVVRNIEVKDNSTSEDRVELYTVQMEDYRGKQFTVKLDIPIMVDNRFLLRGNHKSIQTQFFNMPIIKTEEGTCQIISNYMKIFLRRFREGNGRSLPDISRFIKAVKKYKGTEYKITLGDNSKICSKYQLPIDYIDLATEISKIDHSKFTIFFDQDEIRNKFKVDDSKGIPFAYDKKKQQVIYATGHTANEFINEMLNFIAITVGNEFWKEEMQKQTPPSTCTFSRASIMNSQIPLVVICAYHIGLRATMDRANIKYEIVKSRSKDLINNGYDFIQFEDGYIAYQVNYSSSLLMNGLKECNTKLYQLADMDDRNTYLELLDNYGGRIKADGLDNFYDLMVDPMTKETLEFYHMPTDYIDILIYANNLLADNKFIKHTDTSSRRIRRYQLIAVYTYKVLSDAFAAYVNQIKHTPAQAQFMVKQSAVIDRFLTDSITSDDSVINALRDLETTNSITTKGPSGMNSDRAYSLDKRTYDESMLNVVALSTGFAGNVGITRQATMNANVTPEGFVKSINGNTEKMNSANTLSATEALTPFGSTHDDPFRTAMTFVQTSKHQVRTVVSDPLLVTNGADEAMPYMSSNRFAFKTKMKGKVIELTDDYILLEYTNGEKDYINLTRTIEKNSDGGYYVDLKLDAVDKLKVGSLVQENQIVAYDKQSYSNSLGETDNLAYNIGTLAKIAVLNSDETFEDSGIISKSLANKLATRVTEKHDMVLDKGSEVYSLVKVGDHIEAGQPLMVWQSPFEDEDANALIKVLADKDEVSELGKRKLESTVTGTVTGIKIFRTVEVDELSDSLKKIVTAYEKPLKALYDKLKENKLDTSQVPAHYILPAVGKLKKAQDAILIEIYVEYQDSVGIGDKVVFYSANKAVEKSIFPEGLEPYCDYRPNEKLDSICGMSSIARRMVTSILQVSSINTMMIELARHVRDILGIPYDDSIIY